MQWRWEQLDLACVPFGMLLLVLHHLQFLYRLWRFPSTTSIGINHSQQRLWMMKMMQNPQKNGVVIVQTMRNTMMASSVLATASLTICSLIATMVGRNNSRPQEHLILGDKGAFTSSLKLCSVLVCFLAGLICNVQSVRYYNLLSVLLAIPEATAPAGHLFYVNQAFYRASMYWTIGLRAFYFSLPMFLWIFGPLPMVTGSVITVVVLSISDNSSPAYEEKACLQSIGKIVVQG